MFPHTQSISGHDHPMLQFPLAPTMPLPMESSRWKPNNIELAPNCPRCASSNTKFCYYNNYSLSQPRYFCKGCRRYWTKGGSLRNVPVGGGCRKNRRAKSSSARHSQSERGTSMNYTGSCSGYSGSQDKPDEESKTSDIDMAVVFAKFLNQNLSSGQESGNGSSPTTSNLSNSLTPESVETENEAVLESGRPSDPITNSDDQVLQGGVLQEETIFVGEELSGIELEGLLGVDEVVQDVFWSDATTSSSCLTWQQQPPVMQLQDLGYSMPLNEDGELPVSSTVDLISDAWSNTWGSFDLSTLEDFSSRP